MHNKERIKAIIVDDEPLARKKVETFCIKAGNIDVLGSFQNPIETLDFLQKETVDTVLLDIRIGDLTGFEFMVKQQTKLYIIITLSYA